MIDLIAMGGVGILLLAFGFPLTKRLVPPNHWYGFRTRRTRADEGLWYRANAELGQTIVMAGTTLLASAMMIRIFADSGEISPSVIRQLVIALGLVAVFMIVRRAYLCREAWVGRGDV